MFEQGCCTSLYTWPSTHLIAGSIPGTPVSWCCPSPPVIQIESSQCPQTFHHFNQTFMFGNRGMSKGDRKEGSVHYGLILQVLEYRNSVLFPVVNQWTGHKFSSELLQVEILVKMCRPKMLNMPLIMSSWMTWCNLSRFSPVHLMTSNLKIENPQPQFGCFWNVNTIQRLCSNQHIITMKHCFKHLVSLTHQFLMIKTKLDANSLFLKVWLSTGLQWLQNALSTNTHKRQLHKNARFCYSDITQIHNKSTGQYIALYLSG